MTLKGFRGEIFHCLGNSTGNNIHYEYYSDGVMLVQDGKVLELGHFDALQERFGDKWELELIEGLITPGLIDTHCHYPQTEMIGSYGDKLLDWLNNYTFPTEIKFSDPDYCQIISEFFINEMLKNGTTSCVAFATVHPQSVDAIFTAAQKKDMRLISGKVLMDRHAPKKLLDTPEQSFQQSAELIEKWHGKGRLAYAVTPRFAPTSSPKQLQKAGELVRRYPEVYVQTHVSENTDEIKWVSELFPDSESYLSVYRDFGLLNDRSILAHGIHLSFDDLQAVKETGATIAFCPSSNLFLGSGILSTQRCKEQDVKLSLATDVGAGSSFSMLNTLLDAYKSQQLIDVNFDPIYAWYLATLAGAQCLGLEQEIGSFQKGCCADFVEWDLSATELLDLRTRSSKSIEDKLFALIVLGDDRAVRRSFIKGIPVYQR